ncbi:MAG: hypothetical protein IT347_01355 [Candidatus Eisenbacteria bacterium]|nr:hypothetical protein [Candidatus Eisenbacteria bacterium]
MVCPFASLLGVGAAAAGTKRLFVRDYRYRAYTWSVTALLTAGWLFYFLAMRRPGLRITLEVASVLALVIGALRVRTLVRSGQVAPLTAGAFGRVLAAFGYAVRSPWVAGAKAWLFAMLVFEWLGRAHFTALEYAVSVAVVLALLTVRLMRRPVGTRFESLERFGAGATASTCPLGFGCAVGGPPSARDPGEGSPREAEAVTFAAGAES